MSITPRYGPAPEGATQWRPKWELGAVQLTEGCDWQAIADWCAGTLHPAEGEHRPAWVTVWTSTGARSAYAGDWIAEGQPFEVHGAASFAQWYETAGLVAVSPDDLKSVLADASQAVSDPGAFNRCARA